MSTRLHVVFDGRCGFCTRAVGWVEHLDRHGRIELHAWQHPGVPERFGLTPQQCDASVWAVPAAGDNPLHTARRPRGGGAPVAACRGAAPPRGRLPGVTPWCEQHPGQCVGHA